MTKFLIPDIGFDCRLTEDFTTDLVFEGRNNDVIRHLVPDYQKKRDKWYMNPYLERVYQELVFTVTIPALTELRVARVYIRKGASEYSSVTFNITDSPDLRLKLKSKGGKWEKGAGIRQFFLSLDEVNRMEIEII